MWIIVIWLIWWVFAFVKPMWVKAPVPAVAMSIAPFIFYNDKYYNTYKSIYGETRLRNHENQHIKQQRILSPAGMLILYLMFYFVLFVIFWVRYIDSFKAHKLAYWYNPFEINARNHE
ncbi:hypothetical protein SU69_07335 [Thermosipho melanesiensis]|uniref:Uncharacterized protein n=2 Tax=Thermosipho melanesiensis TaxID=46541 RepID=A6LMZ1_THEM4|nr:hypothetical protein [Thermosipho melanesiensis]ABR31292.1 hypothetical protein Tmel_1445 [Thermosipho melanesiensis BI429]APT74905.1 hypothetical protein BW47_07665 [Thermosipho melanesiensis]OOC36314.1 hypothetical protein SU68_07405 [Thermosipho melanesiensis]OOC37132.1 hypothetical protein SU69_07335 [Thermosipho melanesiensis]OOC37884.1 hypothetical protein SU70_07345 [Thermosipho melanesiensis]